MGLHPAPPGHEELMAAMRRRRVVGDPATARAEIERLAATYDVEEVMLHPVAGAPKGTDPATSPIRERTLELLAGARDSDLAPADL